MGKFFSKVFSFLGVKAPKVKAPMPVAQQAEPIKEDLKNEDSKAKQARANLYATEGGVSGQELSPDQVQKRPTLFGN